MARAEQATLGGGCFWCLEAVFTRLRGVTGVESGYAGGHVPSPTYEAVCTGTTGHAEDVRVDFDPEIVDYREILEVFFGIHDPTTPDRQGGDVGPQYRSVIFTHDEAQAAAARAVLTALAEEGLFPDPIVTQVEPLTQFWPAEAYHRDYFERHPGQPYCQAVVGPKVAKFRQRFAGRLRDAG
jgi:peptide-methionine (S)-S-oxide reductase